MNFHYLLLGETFDETGKILAKNQVTVRTNRTKANLNFDKKSKPSNDIISMKEPPNRHIDKSVEIETNVQQDTLFRLVNGSSEFNHGLAVPILDKLCTLGELVNMI